jgi:hypothetical protein
VRYSAHGGVYETFALLPYQWIVPFHDGFVMGETDRAQMVVTR